MNKKEFLNELEKKIVKLGTRAECKRTLEYFSEVIDDMIESGMTEGEAIEKLGSVELIIDSIQDEFSDEYNEEPTNGEYITDIVAPNVENIIYEDKNQAVRYEMSGDENYHITTYETDEKGYLIEQEGNNIKIISYKKDKFKTIKKFFFNSDNLKIKPVIIKLPRTFSGNIISKTTNGSIQINGISANDINAKTTNGSAHVESVSVGGGKLEVETRNGAIRVQNLAATHTELHTSNGSITLANVATPKLNVSTSNGSINISSIAAETMSATSSNGSIQFGSIAVSNSITLHTSNARICGTLAGKMSDYAITSGTSNAKNNLPNGTNGAIRLDVSTSNGRIDVQFSE